MNDIVQPNFNPLLEKARIPGETFTLHSRGLFYDNGELDPSVKNGEVNILPMAAIDEITLKTPDKLFSGQAIEDVFKRCVPQVLKPLDLHSKDVDFLLTCLRKISFGDNIEIAYNHECSEEAKEHRYVFSIDPFIKESKQIDPTKVGAAYKLTFDNGQTVSLSPLRFKSTLNLYQSAVQEKDMDIDQVSKDLIKLYVGIIQDVDGTKDPEHIAEWLNEIPAGWIHKILEALEKVSDWGPTFEVTQQCKDCGEDVVISSPINPIAFFM